MRVYNTGETEEEITNKYNPPGSNLRNAQVRMVEMLDYLNRICKENNIEYTIIDGTLLGAVRHGGFIPWDDDIDILMKPEAVEAFTKIVNSGENRFIVQNHETDPGFYNYWSVLRDKNSEYVKSEIEHNLRKFRGLQVDLFTAEKNVSRRARTFINYYTLVNSRYIAPKSKLLSDVVYWIGKGIIRIIHCLSKRRRKDEYIAFGVGSCFDEKFIETDIYPLGEIEFEGLIVSCPGNPENVLRSIYGSEYMNIPDEAERSKHKIAEITIKD